MKKILLVVSFVLVCVTASAQYSETISSGRPGQAIGANSVGTNVFQIQAGVDFLEKPNIFMPNSFFRYGISERLEINSGLSYSITDIGNELAGFTVGARVNLYDKADLPSMGLQVSFGLPVDDLEFNSQALFVITDDLTDSLSWTVNLGSNFDKDFNTNGIYVFNLSYSISDKIGVFIEPYGTIDNELHINFDAGVSYLVNKDLQLDFLGGYGINTKQGLLVGLGISWRFLTSDRK